jgi:hypothetical protein
MEKRIEILEKMSGAFALQDYDRAWKETLKSSGTLVGSGKLEAAPVSRSSDSKEERIHQVRDLVQGMNGYFAASCICGLKFSLPPKLKSFACPRCGNILFKGGAP